MRWSVVARSKAEGAIFESLALAGTKYTPLFWGFFCSEITFEISYFLMSSFEVN